MYRLGLNQAKSNNYMFFDFEAPLCLSVDRNTGVVERLTPSILSAIKSGTLILLDGQMPKSVGSAKVEVDKKKIETVVSSEESVSTMTRDAEGLHVSVEKKEAPKPEEAEASEETKEVEAEPEEEVKKAPAKKRAPAKRAPKKPKAE